MTQLLNQILLSISLVATGSALRCYYCLPNNTYVSEGKPSCIPKPMTCENETHCLSLRRKISQNSEKTYKSCAGAKKCVSADDVCKKLKNSSKSSTLECQAHCCTGDLCNLNVHSIGNGVSSIPVPLTALMTSLWLLLLHAFGLT